MPKTCDVVPMLGKPIIWVWFLLPIYGNIRDGLVGLKIGSMLNVCIQAVLSSNGSMPAASHLPWQSVESTVALTSINWISRLTHVL